MKISHDLFSGLNEPQRVRQWETVSTYDPDVGFWMFLPIRKKHLESGVLGARQCMAMGGAGGCGGVR